MSTELVLRKPNSCPKCGAEKILRIFYGIPTTDALTEVERGDAILGGCMMVRGHPDWCCATCAHRWHDETDPARQEFEELEQRIFQKHRAK